MFKIILIASAILVLTGIIGIFIWARTASRPTNLGVTAGRLAPCPATPNCVTTQTGTPDQMMQPLPYTTSQEEAQSRLLQIVQALPRARVIVNQPGYLAIETRSPTFGFPDDTEFLFDDANKIIHFRAAARLGKSDMGMNRKRMEEISRRFQAQ